MTLPNLTPNTTYYVHVIARDLIGNFSQSSNVVVFTTTSGTTTVTTVIHEGFFETGFDNWVDGGSDCARYSGNRSYEGNYSIRIRDNSGVKSSMTSESFDLSSYDYVEFSFEYFAHSMELGEDFFLRFKHNGSWVTIATFESGVDFNGNGFNSATVTLQSSNFNFSTNNKFRLQCDASANNDRIYIDQVVITGYETITNSPASTLEDVPVQMLQKEATSDITFGVDKKTIIDFTSGGKKNVAIEGLSLGDDTNNSQNLIIGMQESPALQFNIYPNPATDVINLKGLKMENVKSVSILDLSGKLLIKHLGGVNQIEVSTLQSGLYLIKTQLNNGERFSKPFIKN